MERNPFALNPAHSASLWIGELMLSADYAAGGYQGVMGAFAGIAAATFVLGVVSGGRDQGTASALPLAEEAGLIGPLGRWALAVAPTTRGAQRFRAMRP